MIEEPYVSFETKQALKNLDEYIVYAEHAGWDSSAEWARKAAEEIRRRNTAGSPEARLDQIKRQYLQNPGDMTAAEVLTAIRHLATIPPEEPS